MFKWLRKSKSVPVPAVEIAPIISKLALGPTDILVFTVPGNLSNSQFGDYAQILLGVVCATKGIDRNRVWVIPADLKISVITNEQYQLIVGKKSIP